MSFKLSLNRAAVRRKRGRLQVSSTAQPRSVAPAFGQEDDSEDSDESPRAQKVTTISAHVDEKPKAEESEQLKEGHVEHQGGNKSDAKISQVATIVERRKEANISSAIPREQKDEALFRYEVANCPDEADVHSYAQRPVDGFGDMMLRSMGWNGKQALEEKYESPVPRPNRLGLGAKPSALKKPTRRKRLRETNSKTDSTPNVYSEENLQNGTDEGVTVNSKPSRSELNHRAISKRPRG